MKALILAGGRGTRLRPLTHTNNKHALPIANKPMIMYPFMSLVDAGIKEIAVLVNETRQAIEDILGDGSKWGVKVTYIYQDHPGGLAHGLSLSEDFMGESPFIMVCGDNMIQESLLPHIKHFQKNNLNGMILGIKVPVEMHSRCGMATVDEDSTNVIRYVEKPGVVDMSELYNPSTSYAVTGFYFFDHNVFQCFKGEEQIQPSSRGELEIASPYNWLIEHKYKVGFQTVEGWWKDPGKPEDLLGANHLVLETLVDGEVEGEVENSRIDGKVKLGKNSKIINSTIRGPVVIGDNCVVEDAYIGPFTSISNACEVIRSEIENSILMDNAKVIDLKYRLDSSLLGFHALATMNDGKPKNLNLFIGDNSEVHIPN